MLRSTSSGVGDAFIVVEVGMFAVAIHVVILVTTLTRPHASTRLVGAIHRERLQEAFDKRVGLKIAERTFLSARRTCVICFEPRCNAIEVKQCCAGKMHSSLVMKIIDYFEKPLISTHIY